MNNYKQPKVLGIVFDDSTKHIKYIIQDITNKELLKIHKSSDIYEKIWNEFDNTLEGLFKSIYSGEYLVSIPGYMSSVNQLKPLTGGSYTTPVLAPSKPKKKRPKGK